MKPFLQICLGVSAVICSAALFIHSATPAKADPHTQVQQAFEQQVPVNHRYDMTIFTPQGETDENIYIIDRQTGKVDVFQETIQNKKVVWTLKNSAQFE